MLREIREQLNCLAGRKPYTGEMLREIQRMNTIDWTYSCLHLGGSEITKEMVGNIIDGQFVVEATIEDHRLVERLEDTLKEGISLLEMDYDLDERVLERLGQKFLPMEELIGGGATPSIWSIILPLSTPRIFRNSFRSCFDGCTVVMSALKSQQIHC